MNKISFTFLFLILINTAIYSAEIKPGINSKYDSVPNSNELEKNTKDSILPQNYLVAYENNIPILDSCSRIADTIGFLKDLQIIERFTAFYYPDGVLAESDNQNTLWYPIKYNNDTGWIDRYENVSLKYDVDTINNLVFRNITGFGEVCGTCYQKSLVYNLKTKNIVLSHSLDLSYSFVLNDSLFLFNFSDSIKIYNSNKNSFTYNGSGGAICNKPEISVIYFLRWNTGQFKSKSPCKLIQYNYLTKKEQVLFIEKDIAKRPFWWGPNYRYLTEIIINDSAVNLFLTFKLFKMKADAQDEGDFNEFNIIVDTSGNVFSR